MRASSAVLLAAMLLLPASAARGNHNRPFPHRDRVVVTQAITSQSSPEIVTDEFQLGPLNNGDFVRSISMGDGEAEFREVEFLSANGYRFDQVAPPDGLVVQRIHFFHPGTSLVFEFGYSSDEPFVVLAHSENGFVSDTAFEDGANVSGVPLVLPAHESRGQFELRFAGGDEVELDFLEVRSQDGASVRLDWFVNVPEPSRFLSAGILVPLLLFRRSPRASQ